MYGHSGYGANSYGSERQTTSLIVQIVKLGKRVFQFAYGQAITFMRHGSARTFTDASQSQTMKLPT
jgi:hypothetical protein